MSLKYSETNGKSLVPVTKNNPCPHCGKPNWCYSVGDLSVCKRNHEPAPGWYKTNGADDDGTPYYAPIKEKWAKPPRPAKTTHYYYPDRSGNPLIRVVRKDDGNGKKSIYQQHWHGKQWVNTLDNVKRENIPIYRYKEVKEAIANGESIFIVEGEGKADLLWSLGLPATCNLAGSGKWRESDTQDLEGSSVILCPDRDVPGVKHCEAIAKDFPNAQWLYCFPDSPLWNHLPESRGADLKDWIDEGANKEDIIKGIGEKKRLNPQKTEKPNNVVSHPKFNPKPLETDKLGEAIDNLITENLTGSKLEIKRASIAKQYGLSDQQVTSIYKERVEENDHDLDKDDLYSDLDNIVRAKNQGIDFTKILPKSLATPILHHARLTGLRPEAYLTAFLTGLGCCHHPDTKLKLYHATEWETSPSIYSCIVAPSGTGKSIIGRVIIEKPLKALIEKDDAEFKSKMKEYKQSLKDPDSDMEKPVRRIRYFSNATGEGLSKYAASSQNKGLLLYKDELAGLFKSQNQYRSGRGSDTENLLEFYDGFAPINLRADPEKTVICRKILLSIYGTIQPAVLEQLLGNKQDDNGQWARFIFCQLPKILTLLDINAQKIDITPAFSHIYESLDSLPPEHYHFSSLALEKFLNAVNGYKKLAFNEQKPALRNVYEKIQESIGKLALNLHIVWNLANQITPSLTIPEDIVDMAIELADFFVNEVKSLQAVMADDLPSHYARILSVATDWISVGKLRAAAFNTKTRQDYPTTRINEVCSELVDKGYGEIRYSIRGSIEFRAFNRDSRLTKIDSVDSSLTKIDSIVNPVKPLPDKDYSMKVDSVDSKIDFSVDTTNPLSEDHTVTPQNSKSDYLLNRQSTESTESNLDKETQSQQGFTKVDNPENSESTLVNLVNLDTDSLEPGGDCIYRKGGQPHKVISVDGDLITIQDWHEENPPFAVAIDEVVPRTPGPERKAKNQGKSAK